MPSETSASRHSVTNIMMRQPKNCVAAEIIVGRLLVESLLERGDIVGDAAENIALCMKVEVFLRHPVNLFG